MKRFITTAVAGALAAGVLATTALPATAASLGSSEVVANWYQDFLGRNLAAARNDPGHLVWSDQLDAGAPRAQVLAEIARSPEYAQINVVQLYALLLGRAPDDGASYWLENIPRGMAVEWVEQNVLASAEFRQGSDDDATWVGELYALLLGREANAGETRYWVQQLRQTGPLATVRSIWFTDEATDARTTRQYVRLLGRTPDGGEVAYWRESEKQSDLATSIAFASSPEYFPVTPADADAAARAAGATQAQADAAH